MENEEQRLSTALQQGDEQAFDALFRGWYSPLVRYAYGFTNGDVDEAEELVQEAFVKLWAQREKINLHHSVKAYLYRMVHNRALNRLRSQRTHERYAQYQIRQMVDESTTLADDPELQSRIKKVLESLPPQCRNVFELSRFESLKYREIAEQLGISVKTVETHMGKALKTLREALSDYFVWLIALIRFLY